jgi:hypothetical protein
MQSVQLVIARLCLCELFWKGTAYYEAAATTGRVLAWHVHMWVGTVIVMLYTYVLLLQEACEQVEHKMPKLFVTGSVYWPTVNVANFMFVPPQQRVLAVNACAIIWNTYLRWAATFGLETHQHHASVPVLITDCLQHACHVRGCADMRHIERLWLKGSRRDGSL